MTNERKNLNFCLFNVTVIQTLSILKEERRIWRKHSAHQSINFTSENDIIRPIRREIYIYILNISARATFARRCTRVRLERAIRPSFSHLSGSSGRVLLSRPSPLPSSHYSLPKAHPNVHFPRYSDPHYVCIGSRARCGTLVQRVDRWIGR